MKDVVGEVVFVENDEICISLTNQAQLISELLGKGLTTEIDSIGMVEHGTDGEMIVTAFKKFTGVSLVAQSPDVPEVH